MEKQGRRGKGEKYDRGFGRARCCIGKEERTRQKGEKGNALLAAPSFLPSFMSIQMKLDESSFCLRCPDKARTTSKLRLRGERNVRLHFIEQSFRQWFCAHGDRRSKLLNTASVVSSHTQPFDSSSIHMETEKKRTGRSPSAPKLIS